MDLNRCALTGRLTADPDLKYTREGIALVRFSVAVSRPGRRNAAGKYEDGEPLFMPVVAWRRIAETVAQFVRKGDRVGLDGALNMSKWVDGDGNPRSKIEMIADRVVFLAKSSKNQGQQNQGTPVVLPEPEDAEDEEAPF